MCKISFGITLSADSALAAAWTIPDHETARRGSVNVDATTDNTKRAMILKVQIRSIIFLTSQYKLAYQVIYWPFNIYVLMICQFMPYPRQMKHCYTKMIN